eukprot:tig00021435_g21398.t1
MADYLKDLTDDGAWKFDGNAAHVGEAVKAGLVIELTKKEDVNEVYKIVDEAAGVDEIPSNGAIIMAYASWCGHCKTAKPEMIKAAAQKNFPFFRVDASELQVDSVAGFPIDAYPTTLVIKDSNLEKEDMQFKSAEYSETRTADGFAAYVNHVFMGGKEKEEAAKQEEEKPAESSEPHLVKADVIQAVNEGKVIELTTRTEFDDFMGFRDQLPGQGGVIMGVKPGSAVCGTVKPHFDKAAEALAGKAAFVRVSLPEVFGNGTAITDDAGKTLADVPVEGYPTTVIFKHGAAADGSAFDEQKCTAGKALGFATAVNDFLALGLDGAALDAQLKDFAPPAADAAATPAAQLDQDAHEAAAGEGEAACGYDESEYVDIAGLGLDAVGSPDDAGFYIDDL